MHGNIAVGGKNYICLMVQYGRAYQIQNDQCRREIEWKGDFLLWDYGMGFWIWEVIFPRGILTIWGGIFWGGFSLWDGIFQGVFHYGMGFSEGDFHCEMGFSAWDFIMGWDFLKGIFTMGWDLLTSTMGFSYISKVKEILCFPIRTKEQNDEKCLIRDIVLQMISGRALICACVANIIYHLSL